jgi:hypothetical protein
MYHSAVMRSQVEQLTCGNTSTNQHSQAREEPTRAPFATQSATHFDLPEGTYRTADEGSKASLIPRETQIGFPSPQQVLDDRDLLDMSASGSRSAKPSSTATTGPPPAQTERTDRLAHTKDVAAACHPYRPSPIAG